MHIARREGSLPLIVLGLVVFAGALILISNRGAETPAALSFDPSARLRAAAGQQPATKTEEQIWSLQDRVYKAPADVDGHALLGAAYVQRARETGDPSYYTKAAAVLDKALKFDPQHIEALIGAGTLALARHEFREALVLGEQARSLNPTIPRIYGVISDAQIELGLYDEAVQSIQTMVNMRPDLSSYSRVAYARELHGDVPGAIEAMQAAVAAGGPSIENTQWVRVQLGNLYFNSGDLHAAEQIYQRALAQLPDDVHALAGLARVHAARGEYATAIKLYTDVTQRMPLPEYVIALGDVYATHGDHQQAQHQYDLVKAIDTLSAANGVNTDLELALFFADHDIDLETSLGKARAAYAARPSIHAADVLAWTLYKVGDYQEAQRYATEALALGTGDPLKLFHAGMIAHALGQNEQARAYLQEAIDLNPHFSLLGSDLAVATLEELATKTTTEGDK
jgi:tetratricopeptide (TPR) repeat protein